MSTSSSNLLRKRTSGKARSVLSVESGDGHQILQQQQQEKKKLTSSQRSSTIDNADFIFKICTLIVFIFSIFYIGISFIGVGNAHYSHQILAYTAPLLILAAVVGVCVPIILLLTSKRKQLTPYERMKVNKNILKKLKRSKFGSERRERRERRESEDEDEESSNSESSSESSSSSSDDSDSSLSSDEEKEQ